MAGCLDALLTLVCVPESLHSRLAFVLVCNYSLLDHRGHQQQSLKITRAGFWKSPESFPTIQIISWRPAWSFLEASRVIPGGHRLLSFLSSSDLLSNHILPREKVATKNLNVLHSEFETSLDHIVRL